MKRFGWWAMLALAAAVGCNRATQQPEETPVETQAVVGEYVVGEPIAHGNLTIFPVMSQQPRDADRFITLDEGLRAGTIEIREVGAAADELPAEENPVEEHESLLVAWGRNLARAAEGALRHWGSPEAGDARDPFDLSPREVRQQPSPATNNPFAGQADHAPQQTGNLPTLNGAEVDEALELFVGNQGNDGNPANSGNEVNKLLVVNNSGRPLYLMPGEIILGGDQDRSIGEEIVVAPTGEPVPIDVFCVEHGRWGGKGEETTIAQLQVAVGNPLRSASVALTGDSVEDLARQADQGKFVASIGCVSPQVRLAVQGAKDQGQVWDQVAQTNAASMVDIDSGAFTANYAHEDAVARLEPFIEQLQQPVNDCPQVVGVIVAVDGRVRSMDVFESTPLFRKLWPKLLKSYALDAATSTQAATAGESAPAESASAAQVASRDAACQFLRDAMESNVDKSDHNGHVAVTTRSNDRVVSFSAETEAAASPSGVGGALGGVHASAFAH